MNAPTLLVQGPASAHYWTDRQAKEPLGVSRWVVYDARSARILSERRIDFVRFDHYLDAAAQERMKRFEKLAYDWSACWYRDTPFSENVGEFPELFAFRGWAFYFLVVLRSLVFLECLIKAGTKGEVFWTTKNAVEEGRGLRWTMDDSPLPALLEHLGPRFGCKTEFFDLETPKAIAGRKRAPVLSEAFVRAMERLKREPCRVLFSGNPALLGPVEEALRANGVTRLHRIRHFSRLKELGLLFSSTRHLIAFSSTSEENVNEDVLRHSLEKNGMFRVDGMDLLPVLWPKIKDFYRFERPGLREGYREIAAVLARLRPEYVVVDEDAVDFNKMLVIAAKNAGIKTLVVQHGLPGDPLGFMPLQADHMAAWGMTSRQTFEKWGMEASRIVVTGCPKYDGCADASSAVDAAIKRRLCDRLGWTPDKPLALITPDILRANAFERFEGVNPDPFEVLQIAKNFIALAEAVPGVNFIYKFHGGSWDQLEESENGLPSNFKWMAAGVAFDFIAGCDLVFNDISSAGLEAIILRRPLVVFNFTSVPDFYPFEAYGLEPVVRTFEAALELCRGLAQGTLPLGRWVKEQERLLAPLAFSRDGRSAQRTALFIRHRLEGRPAGRLSDALVPSGSEDL